jgi:hypothetical protein
MGVALGPDAWQDEPPVEQLVWKMGSTSLMKDTGFDRSPVDM